VGNQEQLSHLCNEELFPLTAKNNIYYQPLGRHEQNLMARV